MYTEESMSDVLSCYRKSVENSLPAIFEANFDNLDLTMQAARYSLLAGGKRIRPVLMLSISDLLGGSQERVMPYACAIEMIHTYSLIHDDLPCMDNDDTRRGNPTCHKKYTEPIALLAGDLLLNRAYEVLFSTCIDSDASYARAALYLADMAGGNGMIGGQTKDILSQGRKITQDELYLLHQQKTGCLLKAAIVVPAFLFCNENREVIISLLEQLADEVGISFQIKDDILDVVSSKEVLGKSVGKDRDENKSTYVTCYGLDQARSMLRDHYSRANSALYELQKKGYDISFLLWLNQYLFERES